LEGDDIFRTFEFGETLFKLNVEIHGACDRPHCAWTHPIFLCYFPGSFHDLRVVCQSQIIVRAEVEHVLSIYSEPGTLWRTKRADVVVQALFFQASKFLYDPIEF